MYYTCTYIHVYVVGPFKLIWRKGRCGCSSVTHIAAPAWVFTMVKHKHLKTKHTYKLMLCSRITSILFTKDVLQNSQATQFEKQNLITHLSYYPNDRNFSRQIFKYRNFVNVALSLQKLNTNISKKISDEHFNCYQVLVL